MCAQKNRLREIGRIDRFRKIRFQFNGKKLSGYQGDTLSSALLANDVRIVGRSFKYHRPRGFVSAGVDETNAYVQLNRGARQDPNSLATTTELYDGLEAWSQNAWPSPKLDLLSLNNFLSPILVAGFYYKTFIGTGRGTRTWMFFEKFIRRAAGMGVAGKEVDPDNYEKAHAFCDVLIVGAGPAGLAAALAAAKVGAQVILAEQGPELGGSLLDSFESSDSFLSEIKGELKGLSNVRILKRTCVYGAYDNNCYGAVERVRDHIPILKEHQIRQRHWVIRSKRTILATGAIERPIVFSGNDRPGVMLASAVRTYINRYGVLPGRTAVVFTNNDSAYATVQDLARVGAKVTLIDCRSSIPDKLLAPLEELDVTVHTGSAIVSVKGNPEALNVVYGKVDNSTGRLSTRGQSLRGNLVCISGGWSPVLHLWSQRSGKPLYDARQGAFVPTHDRENIVTVGACAGSVPLRDTVLGGDQCGRRSANCISRGDTGSSSDPLMPKHVPYADTWDRDMVPLWCVSDAKGKVKGKAFVDLQNDVTIADIKLAYREGYSSAEHLKRYTTLGMAIDQGKTSNVNALALLAERRDVAIQEVGTTTFRPPYTPVSIGVLSGHEHGRHFRPTRISPLHDWHTAHGAVMVEAGLWLRPWYYARDNESYDQACIREARHVREKVGIIDVSTLGKIVVQGPDAAEFLDRIYVNNMKNLEVHQTRYGVMLRDDGFVKDDGTVSRISESIYLVTTTTANAASVLGFQEFLLQTSWRSLQVSVTCVTDQWATIAIAGPHARSVLQAVTDNVDLSNAGLPHMRLRVCTIRGTAVRVHRMSYSGELAYEVYVEAGLAHHVWAALMTAGREHDILPYGTKAMDILRIEKGHVAGPEIDGRTTLKDLGLEKLASKRKPFVGSVLRGRLELENADRPTLVGLVAKGEEELRPGSILFSKGTVPHGHGEGFVTSSCYSPALQKHIALGLLTSGRKRKGETVQCSNPLEGACLPATVSSPHFYDAPGERLYA